ncbi:MAG: DUF1801 domain-containing protein [Rhodospirillaceae bacterium]|nr:DUF1801 domain-containing protein [Rhodospirillaceae bacterium]
MVRAGNKTTATGVAPADFIATVEPPRRRDEGAALLDWFGQVTGLPARMWGPSIIGYGRYRYRYESGREGEFFLTGFSPRKAALTVYVLPGYRDLGQHLARLGKHKTGKSCLYFAKLADVDLDVLREIVDSGLAYMRANYETWDE